MANSPTKGVGIGVGVCPSCGGDLIAAVDIVPESLTEPAVAQPKAEWSPGEGLVAPPPEAPGMDGKMTVDLTVRLTGMSLVHRCGTRTNQEAT